MAETSMSKRRNTQDSYLPTTELKYFRIPSEVGTKNFERSAKMIAWCDRSKWQFSPSGFFLLLSACAAAKAHCCCPKETSSNEVSAAQNHPQMSTLVSSKQSWECAMWTEFKVWRQAYSGRAWLGCGLNQALQPSLSSSCTQSPGKEMLFHDALHQLPSHLASSGAQPHSFSNSRAAWSLMDINPLTSGLWWFRSWKTRMATKAGKAFNCFWCRTQVVYLRLD